MSPFDLFRRRKDPAPTLPDSPEDWMPGDIAVCVQPGGWLSLNGSSCCGPEEGQSFPVLTVLLLAGAQFLAFEQFLPNSYHSIAFVKVRPDERKACDPWFRKLIRKRSRERVGA